MIWPKNDERIAKLSLWDAVAAGLVNSAYTVHKFGENQSVAATPVTVWGETGVYLYPGSAQAMRVSAANSFDNAAGAGARTVRIHGVDSAWNLATEDVTSLSLAVQSHQLTATLFRRVFRLEVLTVGASLSNFGSIYAGAGTLTAGKPATVFGSIQATKDQSQMAMYTIPDGYTGFVHDIYGFTSISKQTDLELYARDNMVANAGFNLKAPMLLLATPAHITYKPAAIYTQRTDLEMRAAAVAAGGTVSALFCLTCMPNS